MIPLREIDRYARAWVTPPKGASKADARGHSATRENAQNDAILMAQALIQEDEKLKKQKKGKGVVRKW